MRADKVVIEKRLDEIEKLWLEGFTRAQIVAHLQAPTPLKNCLECKKTPKTCSHGPPRWTMPSGKPVSLRTIQWYLTQAQERILLHASQQRKFNRAFTLGQVNHALEKCWQGNHLKEATALLRFRSELDGSRLAAEELQTPNLYERVRTLMATCEDYTPTPPPKKSTKPVPALEARFLLEQLEQWLLQADTSVARYRKARMPTNEVEARLYFRTQLVEAVHQALTFPGLSPEGRREALQKLGNTYAMIAKEIDLAEKLEELKQTLQFSLQRTASSP